MENDECLLCLWRCLQLLGLVAAAAPHMEPQQLSSVLYALATWQQQQLQQQQAQLQQAQLQLQQQQAQLPSQAPPSLQQQHAGDLPTAAAQPEAAAARVRDSLGIPPQLPEQLLAAAASHWHLFGPQALSNVLYAAAVLQLNPSLDWQSGFWSASSRVLPVEQAPQHLSNMAWASATLGLIPPGEWREAWLQRSRALMQQQQLQPMKQQQQRVTAQGFSNSLWAVATLGWGPAVLAADDNSSYNSSSSSWLGVFLQSSLDALDGFADQGLTNCCWALGRLAQQQQQQQSEQQQQSQEQQHQRVSDLLVSTGWLDRLLFVLQPRLLGLTSQQLSNTVWGLATTGAPLPAGWLDVYVR